MNDFAYDQNEDGLGYAAPRLGQGGHDLKIVATDAGDKTKVHQHGFRVLRSG